MTALDLLNSNIQGQITEAGIRANCSAALQYVANWVSLFSHTVFFYQSLIVNNPIRLVEWVAYLLIG